MRVLLPMTDPTKLTDQELEVELVNLWMVITEYTRRYGELTAEQDRRERQGSARKWTSGPAATNRLKVS
jgi:hypothetical protein